MEPDVRSEVYMAMNIQAMVFWVVIPCSNVVGYHHFGGPSCLQLHSVMTQKTSTWVLILSEVCFCPLTDNWTLNMEYLDRFMCAGQDAGQTRVWTKLKVIMDNHEFHAHVI